MDTNGGSWTTLAMENRPAGSNSFYWYGPVWNSDDSKYAGFRTDSILGNALIVFNASTGSPVDSVSTSYTTIGAFQWSHAGTNSIAFTAATSSTSPVEIYYVTPTTGSTPTTNSVQGHSVTWSPNNSSVMFRAGLPSSSAIDKCVAFSSSTSQILSTGMGNTLDWKH